jgi:hypothetical protein
MAKRKITAGNDDQVRRFKDAAREVGASEDEASFDKMLKRFPSSNQMTTARPLSCWSLYLPTA